MPGAPQTLTDQPRSHAMRSILILGAGELGTAVIESLLEHAAYDSTQTSITLLVRPVSLSSTASSEKRAYIESLHKQGIKTIGGDLNQAPLTELVELFRPYSVVIHAGGTENSSGTQLKITQAALDAGVEEYVPWQFGVDYDVLGPDAAGGIFKEQCAVRRLLRSQTKTKWYILSCGIYMSLLFSEYWGVLKRDEQGRIVDVRALGGWDHLLTATTAKDIAKANAEVLLVDRDMRGKVIYIAGDTVTYSDFADLIGKIVGRELPKELCTTEELKKQYNADASSKLTQYRWVFSLKDGLAWDKASTYNVDRGIEMQGYENYAKEHLSKM